LDLGAPHLPPESPKRGGLTPNEMFRKYSVIMSRQVQPALIPYLLFFVLTGSTLLVLPYSVTDPINLPKMVFMSVGAMLIFGLMLGSGEFKIRRIHYPFLLLILSFILALVTQLVTTTGPMTETFYGIPGRNTGILTYMSFTLIVWISFHISSIANFRKIFSLAAILGLILAIYGIFQELGKEPFPYMNVYESNVFGTFGNPNFQSAFLGVIAVLAFSTLFADNLQPSLKLFHLVLLILSLLGVYQTNSIQGFFNFTIGSAIFVFLLLYTKKFYRVSIALGILIVFGIINVVLSFFQIGPLAELIYKGSMSARVYYWDTAIRIWSDFPIVGVGLDQYGDWLRVYRSSEEVKRNVTADSSHSVYLDILSGGGAILFLLYICFTIFAIRSIVRVMKRSTTPPIEFLILVGLWVAHQAQSLISIGHIGVAVWGWVFTGLIIGYELKTRETASDDDNKKARVIQNKNGNRQLGFKLVLGGLIGAILGCVLALPPITSASSYYNSFKTSDARVIKTATYAKPYNRNSFIQVSRLLKANQFDSMALEVAADGVRYFPNSFFAWRALLDMTQEGTEQREQALSRLRELDPNNPDFMKK
jgi:O-antigen ligase